MKLNELNTEEKRIILEKGTEAPFSGKFKNNKKDGIYTCRQCGAFLYRSSDKFDSNCGWPSFDDEIKGSIKKSVDADGARTEITCIRCGGHLGHVFYGERFTAKNTRHCVNSISMDFIESEKFSEDFKKEKIIYFGGGCFWCVEAVFKLIDGVIDVVSGYAGGDFDNPSYDDVCTGKTGHAEVVRIIYDSTVVSEEHLLSVFFDAHDPTTLNRQGNDIGTQYRSVIFTENIDDLDIAVNFIKKIQNNFDDKIVTDLKILSQSGTGIFYPAENYHKDYFNKNDHAPYCQLVILPKVEKIKKKYL